MQRKKLNKIIKILTIISALITIVSASFRYLLRLYVKFKFKINIKDASAVGVIGGADGPTMILLESNSHRHIFTLIFAVFSILGMIYLITEKHLVKKS